MSSRGTPKGLHDSTHRLDASEYLSLSMTANILLVQDT